MHDTRRPCSIFLIFWNRHEDGEYLIVDCGGGTLVLEADPRTSEDLGFK
jgi:hypothetical protein